MTFEALYDLTHDPILHWFEGRPLTSHDAEEWTAQTFVKAWAKGGLERCVDDHHQRARVWLIAHNLYNDECRHHHAAPWFTPLIAEVHDVADVCADVPEQVEAGERYRALVEVVTRTLPAKAASAMLLTAEGVTTPVIARCLHIEPNAVRVLMYRARQRLKDDARLARD